MGTIRILIQKSILLIGIICLFHAKYTRAQKNQTDTTKATITYFIDFKLVGGWYNAETHKTEFIRRNLFLMDTLAVEPGLHKFRKGIPQGYTLIPAERNILAKSRPAGYGGRYDTFRMLNLKLLTYYLNNPDFVEELRKLGVDVKQLMKMITTEDVY